MTISAEVESELQGRVANGAAFLDEQVLDWFTKIDLENFEMDHPCLCVLGQLDEDWNIMLEKFWPNDAPIERWVKSAALGFTLSLSDQQVPSVLWQRLEQLWVEAINERRSLTSAGSPD